MSFAYGVAYNVHVSYRPQIGYYRVILTRLSDNAVIADSGHNYDTAGITNVRFLSFYISFLFCNLQFHISLFIRLDYIFI